MRRSSKLTSRKFVLLVVLDGWGIAPPESHGDAITQADTPNMDKFWASFPHTKLGASGDSVGLPRGEVGNTETGHINLGAGRIVYQDLARINMAIADGSFLQNRVLLDAVDHAKKNKSSLHIMGLVGAGGVHSNIEHLFALIQMANKEGIKDVFIHAFTDGRDSPPNASNTYLAKIDEVTKKEGVGRLASVMGRYWAMDRDRRWDRTKIAYDALTNGEGQIVKNMKSAIEDSYANGTTDEFLKPMLASDANGKPIATIKDNDAIIFYNFRIDRPRQLTESFLCEKVEWREKKLENLYFASMTDYGKRYVEMGAKPAFPPEVIGMPLASVISSANMNQLHITESEKERFVTFYFNGLHERPFIGEERMIIPSPKVATYDQVPEMSCREMTRETLKKLKTGEEYYSFVIMNYPNADMVGHTGNLEATVKAVAAVDECLGDLYSYIISHGGTMLITADHGNAEQMISHEGEGETEHTANMVPFIAISKELLGYPMMLQSGILADIAPTVLSLLGLEVPSSMMGRNLLEELNRVKRRN